MQQTRRTLVHFDILAVTSETDGEPVAMAQHPKGTLPGASRDAQAQHARESVLFVDVVGQHRTSFSPCSMQQVR